MTKIFMGKIEGNAMLRILVANSNTVLLRKIRKIIEHHLTNIKIDYARNSMILKHRILENEYDAILVDPQTMPNPNTILDILKNTDSTVIQWSIIDNESKYLNPIDMTKTRRLKRIDEISCLQSLVAKMSQLPSGTWNAIKF